MKPNLKMDDLHNLLHNATDQTDNEYEVQPYRVAYSMSSSELGLILLVLFLIFMTLILICIASNLKSSFKKKMSNLGVVVMSVNGKKQVCIQNNLNSVFQAPVDLRTTSFMNVHLSEYVSFVLILKLLKLFKIFKFSINFSV